MVGGQREGEEEDGGQHVGEDIGWGPESVRRCVGVSRLVSRLVGISEWGVL